ncbi:3-hydroxy-9,10-secoandrosta-1,3,5(10)-triene-9,17-dione monooxygenase reductase subunit [Actinomadura syzygii]|uniref:3-hydroxy-9,10-secoandrosta-1,3,5(10)-triene-9, 17-dione monooxygenase reductase subunit n=1 Tax=Actinomadura syzygii TaxID=1427538 RepID=UPI001FECC19E|nr:3-hydroxy-9,10-secoandrosta-1,3,5(10)-triene-9,17-dione monooxygenase reductase subunit [Actinomadura syzygii]
MRRALDAPDVRRDTSTAVDHGTFRRVLGHFCTGVAVITAFDGARPVGFACQSFAALSLDPPLVLFCPAKTSGTWPAIRRAGRFAVNLLAHDQRDVSSLFGRSGADRFTATSWRPSPGGAPLLDGALAWVDCTVHAVHDGGDHHIVVGGVDHLAAGAGERPLLFYRGGYTVTEPPAAPAPAQAHFLTWADPGEWY